MYDATPKDEVPNVRYVHPLTDEHRNLLEQTMKNDASPRARARAHSLLLSVQGLTINEIAKIYHVDRDTVSTWLTKWEQQGEGSLHDQPRSGRPPTLTPEEQELAIAYIKEEPRSLKQVVDRLIGKYLILKPPPQTQPRHRSQSGGRDPTARAPFADPVWDARAGHDLRDTS